MLVQVVIAAFLLTKRLALRAALVVALVAGVLAGTLWVGGDRLMSNFEQASREIAVDANSEGASRKEIWRATLKLFAAHPILGAGLGGYWIAITAYHDASGTLTPQEAHNDYLELLASGGVVGFALGVWFVVSVVRLVRKNLWSNAGSAPAIRIGAILGLAGVAAHSLVDFGLHLMANAVIFLALIMLATATIETRKVIDLNLQEQ
jgi:O-antigen ligase